MPRALTASLLAATLLLACGKDEKREDVNTLPSFVKGTIAHVAYDGASDDLLTAGLGKTGLAGAAPTLGDPARPTAAELRRLAIYNNYRALVDMTAAGGYGTLYGPNVDAAGNDTLGEGRVAGDEYLAYDDDGTGRKNVAMLVQVPASFDRARPCVVTGTSSGSRGVYGAIATSGEWGLKHGCAVAYTDKGSGNGAHDLSRNTVNLLTGERADAATAGAGSHFTAPLSDAERAALVAQTPNRFAFKHAHSKQNPEKDWGQDTLHAVEFALYVLNQQLGTPARNGTDRLRTFTPGNTIVIASSVSNGGGAALAAAEQDAAGLIDGVVAGEPQIQVVADARRQVLRGGNPVAAHGKPLYDYFTTANLYQPCAVLAVPGSLAAALVPAALATNRCAALAQKGLVTGATAAAQAADALAKLRAAGYEPESDVLHASHYGTSATLGVTVTYANAYGRFGVEQRLCNYGFAATAPATSTTPPAFTVVPLPAAAEAALFATGNGVPPTGGVSIVAEDALNGPIADAAAVSRSTSLADLDADGAACLRALQTGNDSSAQAVQTGVREVQRTANLRGKPALLVQGRSDTLVPVNHASRAYLAQNHLAEGAGSQVRYLEVTNAQHFDTFIGALPEYQTRFVPLHRYFVQAMDLMLAHLRDGAPLPESQVVRTTPRAATTTTISATANVPPAPLTAAAADRITFQGDALSVPD